MARESGGGVSLDRAFDVYGVAVPRVAVADDRNAHGLANISSLVDHFRVRGHACIRQAQTRGGNAEAAHEGQRKAGLLDETGGHGIEATRRRQHPTLRKQSP